MVTDPVSDFIIRIKNGSDANKPSIRVSHSKFVENIAHALKKAGYVSSVEKKSEGNSKFLEVGIAYIGDMARVNGVERISKLSKRIYQRSSDIRVFRSGFGNTFLSTPKGVMTDMEAKKNKVGGEVLFRIW
jgi:small subunit ribosomal protein S8